MEEEMSHTLWRGHTNEAKAVCRLKDRELPKAVSNEDLLSNDQ